MNKKWIIGPGAASCVKNYDDLINILLAQRKVVTPHSRKSFFQPNYKHDIHDPFAIYSMDQAVLRINRAIKKGEQILVWGDYDVDGISSTAILILTLRRLGAKVVPFLPHRSEHGYGLHQASLNVLISQFSLLISVDCGISNYDEIKWLKQKQKNVIIVDHHDIPKKLPPADVILHSAHPQGKYPFPYLCGAAMAWKLASALYQKNQDLIADYDFEIKSLLDLACLGTVADMVPLYGENRAIVAFGLNVLSHSPRPGIRVLRQLTPHNSIIDTDTIAFRIAPLLNAAGRMDHAQPALDLLLSENIEQAQADMRTLRRLNDQRRTISKKVQDEAENTSFLSTNIIFAANKNWPIGVVGLVAGRLSEKFSKPAVVIGSAGNLAVGSARAPAGENLLSLLAAGQEHLVKFGGHKRAAGFSLKQHKIKEFEHAIQQVNKNSNPEISQVHISYADAEVTHDLLDWNLVELINEMAPFGEGNKQPQFLLRQLYIGDIRSVGKSQEHIKISFRLGDKVLDSIGFGLAPEFTQNNITPRTLVDIIGSLEVNEYNNRRTLQMQLKAIAPTGSVEIMRSSF